MSDGRETTAIVEMLHDAHPKEIETGDYIVIGPGQEVRVKHVWRTGTGPYDNTWVDVGLYYSLQISHVNRLNIKRPIPSLNGRSLPHRGDR